MIWWTGLAPWEFEFPFPGSLISTFLGLRTNLKPVLLSSFGTERFDSEKKEKYTFQCPLEQPKEAQQTLTLGSVGIVLSFILGGAPRTTTSLRVSGFGFRGSGFEFQV